jgi:hypothetical protein
VHRGARRHRDGAGNVHALQGDKEEFQETGEYRSKSEWKNGETSKQMACPATVCSK